MSNIEDRKHLLLSNLNHQQLATNISYSIMGGGHQNSDEERDYEIPQGWISPIRDSIDKYNQIFSRKQRLKQEIIERKNLDEDKIKLLKLYEFNRFDIFFYKIVSITLFNDFVETLVDELDLKSFHFVKLDYNNTCLSCCFNYEDSEKFISLFNNIISAQDWNLINTNLHVFRLIKKFELLTENTKLINNTEQEGDDDYNIFIPNKDILIEDNIKELLSSFSLELLELNNKAEGIYLKVRGNINNVYEFLPFFDVSENVFSSLLLTRIFSDDESPANINRELRIPTILGNGELPVVFLLDSGLPLSSELLNPLIRNFVVEQTTLSSLGGIIPSVDHATQMAGIIIYGDQLNSINQEEFIDSEIIPYAKIYSMVIGDNRPKIGIWSIPEILESLSQIQLNQNIKIFNLSFNLENPKQDNVNIHPFSFFIDKYLFFHPEILVINSLGNYRGDTDGNYFTEECCNLLVPSDGINILSVGSFGKDDNGYKIALGSTKNHYDKGSIINKIRQGTNNLGSLKRMENYYKKPDVLGLGENWECPTVNTTTSILTHGHGTSHATAYVSSLAAQLLKMYPSLKYAMSLENLLLKFTKNLNAQHEINFSMPINPVIQSRIDDLINKTDLNEDIIKAKENEFIQKRFSGDRVLEVSNIFYNAKNRKTLIIEGEINLGTMDSIRINLCDYILKSELESSTVSIDGFLSYRGMPFIGDSIGYNIISVSSAVWFTSDYQNGDFLNKDKIRWSSNQCCQKWVRYPRNYIEKITTKTHIFKNLLVQNDWNIDVILKSVIRRKRDNEIKEIIKEYFDELGDSNCVERLNEAFIFYQETHNINIEKIKIPYSLILSIDVHADIDVYDVVETTISEEISI